MKQLVVISGKGGTGKTSVVASLAYLAAFEAPVTTADCDVEAANLALLLPGQDIRTEPFCSGRRATIDAGHLLELCAFAPRNAERVPSASKISPWWILLPAKDVVSVHWSVPRRPYPSSTTRPGYGWNGEQPSGP